MIQPFFHSDFPPTFGEGSILHLVHEGADIKYASSTRLQEITRIQRVRQFGFCEPLAFILNTNDQAVTVEQKSNADPFFFILFVTVQDRIGNGFPNRKTDPVAAVVVQPQESPHSVRDTLNDLKVLEPTAKENFYVLFH